MKKKEKKYLVVDTMYGDGSWVCPTKQEVLYSCGEEEDTDWDEFIAVTKYQIIELTGKVKYLTEH